MQIYIERERRGSPRKLEMASPKVVATNSDLLYHSSSISSIIDSDLQLNNPSMNMDDIINSMNSSSSSSSSSDPNLHIEASLSVPHRGGLSLPIHGAAKTVDELWNDIVAAGGDQRPEGLEGMTLEDFLTKAGAVGEEDVRGIPYVVPATGCYAVDATLHGDGGQFPMAGQGVEGSSLVGFGNGSEGRGVGATVAAGRGKRRPLEETTVDKATQQKQRRMIKNRESAARSRERKQAYTVELESLVTQLEEENARLLREEADQRKLRFKQLMNNLIPIVEKQRPQPMLRRVHSVQW